MAASSDAPYDTQRFADEVREAADFVRGVLGEAEVALVLGSGLNGFIDVLEDRKELPYAEIPHMPTTTVKGHFGRLASGKVGGLKIFCLAGRSHAYEGKNMYQLTFTARLMRALGCQILIATNASGGCGEGMVPGCLMVITDHINLFHRNPVAETFEDRALGVRRPDLSTLYSPRLREKALSTAEKLKLKLFQGVYVSVCGPCYETPAEVQSGRALGGSAFGMSTIPEVVAARSVGMEVFAMSLITNLAAGMAAETITHSHVQMVADVAGPGFVNFMQEFIRGIRPEVQPERAYNATFLPRKHEDPEANFTAPLPPPIIAPATGAQVNAAADYVLAHGVGEGNTLADVGLYFAPSHGAGLVKRLTDARAIPYRDIPHFPSISPSSRLGELVVGALAGGQRVVVLHKNALEGFSCEESVFVARLLRVLGVSTLVHTLIAEKRDAEAKVDDVAVLVDALDFTSIHPWTHNNPLRPIQHARLFNVQPLQAGVAKAFEAQGVKVGEAAYMAFQGPSLPSNAEAAIAHKIGCPLVGTASLGLVYASRSNGISVLGLAQPAVVSKDTLAKVHVSKAIESLLSAHPPSPAQPHREAADLPATIYTQQQVTPHLARPVTQGVPEHIQAAADHVLAAASGGQTGLALIVEDEALFQPFSAHFAQLAEIADIPHLPSGVQLFRGELKDGGASVFVFKGIHYVAEGRPFSEIVFPMRLLHAVGVTRVVLVGRSAACTSKFGGPGDVLIVNDHVNFSGRNPLFGPNDDKWGVRFPDMSNAYDLAIRNVAHDIAEAEGIAVKRAVVGLFVGPVYRSPLDSRLAQLGGADAITTGMVSQVVVARHVGMKVGALSLVSGALEATDDDQAPAAGLEQSAAQTARLAARLLAQLATAGKHHTDAVPATNAH